MKALPSDSIGTSTFTKGRSQSMQDTLISGGLIIDGTGNPGYRGAISIRNNEISIHRGDISHIETKRTIDATNHVVCPGFIDLHSHAGLTILREPHHDPKIRQGVTTELIGIDSSYVEGSNFTYQSGVISDTSIEPGHSADYIINVQADSSLVRYVTREIKWDIFE